MAGKLKPMSQQNKYFAFTKKEKETKPLAKTLSASKNTEVMLPIIQVNPPPAYKAKYLKINFCTRLPAPYPSFAFFL
jgi:GTP-binding protein